jgi:hypothetical protein
MRFMKWTTAVLTVAMTTSAAIRQQAVKESEEVSDDAGKYCPR